MDSCCSESSSAENLSDAEQHSESNCPNGDVRNDRSGPGPGAHDPIDHNHQFRTIFSGSKSYWDNYTRFMNWFDQHSSFAREVQNHDSHFEQWCRSQMAYHVHMANYFYSQWQNFQPYLGHVPAPGVSFRNEMPSKAESLETSCQGSSKHESRKQSRTRKSSRRKRSRRNKRKSSGRAPCHIEFHLANHDPGSEELNLVFNGNEDTEFEMQITESMIEFYSQSAKHRKERDSKKAGGSKAAPETDDNYIEICEASLGKNRATTEAPKERPGLRRSVEMRQLYGVGAAMIHGMETAMQLTFDRNCDRKQPRLWPALPLNLKFH